MRYLIALPALVLFLVGSPSWAKDKIEYQLPPVAARYTLPQLEDTDIEGTPHKCLSMEQWRVVILMANEYKGLYDWRLQIEGVLTAYKIIEEKYGILELKYQSMLKVHERDREYLTLRLKDTTKQSENMRLKTSIERYVMWVVILAETVVITVQGIKD